MLMLLALCLLAVFGGLWLFFALFFAVFRVGFWMIGGLIHLIVGGVALLVGGILFLALLPLAGLLLPPFALPLLLVMGLFWLVMRPARPAPVMIRRY